VSDLRGAGLDYREHAKTTNRTLNTRQVVAGMCGNTAKARAELDWQPNWTLPTTIKDMVQAEIEGRSELECSAPGGGLIPGEFRSRRTNCGSTLRNRCG
jgi:hypothetical protein